ncbi:unnamed protein product [Cuscuta epithymum]|uniref:Uncharacterized protein n=1 Tax=Cuscuta epithymum TaxID=186058 RepID=A0AAV0EID1_9ASTE|nr:unnamed protein product [Cuscuta epithymum]
MEKVVSMKLELVHNSMLMMTQFIITTPIQLRKLLMRFKTSSQLQENLELTISKDVIMASNSPVMMVSSYGNNNEVPEESICFGPSSSSHPAKDRRSSGEEPNQASGIKYES